MADRPAAVRKEGSDGQRKLLRIVLFVVAAAGALWLHLVFRGQGYRADEIHHFTQTRWLLSGEMHRLPNLYMFPLYHLLLAAIASVLGWTRLDDLRLLSLVVSAVSVCFIHRATSEISAEIAVLRTAQTVVAPIVFPLMFLLYTDCVAIGVLIAALWAGRAERHVAAGLCGLAAILLRQTNAVWIVFLAAAAVWRAIDDRRGDSALRATVRVAWPYAAAVVVFLAGSLLAMPSLLRPGPPFSPGLHAGNPLFVLVLAAVLFMPLHLGNARAIGELARSRSLGVGVMLAGVALLHRFAFRELHILNRMDGFLHNELLMAVDDRWDVAVLYLAAAAVAALSLAVTPLSRREGVLLAIASALALPPLAPVEPRYCLVPLVLWNLLRADAGRRIERALVVWNGALAAVMWLVVLRTPWFL